MSLRRHAALLCLLAAAPAAAVQQDPGAPSTAAPATIGYADAADLVLASPVIAAATIRSASRLKGAEAAGVRPGLTRYYVEADLETLVRGAGGVPPRIGYLLDVAPGPDGRLPKLRKRHVLLFARPVPGHPEQVQLADPSAQRDWTPGDEALARRIASEVNAPGAPPAVTGIGNAFHVPGALPGEGETQIFVTTADRSPMTLSILRRPGERPRWAVALSEVVDEAAAPPPRATLLWYRLACGLPRTLPDRSLAALEPGDAQAAREDYQLVLAGLGPCGRTAPAAGDPLSGGGEPA